VNFAKTIPAMQACVKGTVTRDFLTADFLIKQISPPPTRVDLCLLKEKKNREFAEILTQ
jgi:hypothetical protein